MEGNNRLDSTVRPTFPVPFLPLCFNGLGERGDGLGPPGEQEKAPASAATDARANDRKLASKRLQPLYVNPWGAAIPVGTLARLVVAEVERRMHTAARAAKAVKS